MHTHYTVGCAIYITAVSMLFVEHSQVSTANWTQEQYCTLIYYNPKNQFMRKTGAKAGWSMKF